MDKLKDTVGWGMGVLITTAVASKALRMIKPKSYRGRRKRRWM